MKTIFGLVGAVALAVGLAACSPSIHGFGHSVTFQNGELVARAPGRPNAYVSTDGSLRIGKRAIEVTPAQRRLLTDYYAEAGTVTAEGEATGRAGAKLGVQAMGDAVKAIFSGESAATRKDIHAKARAIRASALQMCNGVNRLQEIQREIAAQLPAFTPYDATGGAGCNITSSADASATIDPAGAARTTKPAAAAH